LIMAAPDAVKLLVSPAWASLSLEAAPDRTVEHGNIEAESGQLAQQRGT
jgi:hypothetical protein